MPARSETVLSRGRDADHLLFIGRYEPDYKLQGSLSGQVCGLRLERGVFSSRTRAPELSTLGE